MNKQKVLLLAPYLTGMLEGLEELGICYLTSVLRENGNEVMLISNHKDLIDYDKICTFHPDMAGMPVYETTKTTVYEIAEKLHELLPEIRICVGGTQPTYYGVEMMQEMPLIDFAVRGEGEVVFRELVNLLEERGDYTSIKGLIYRDGDRIVVNDDQERIDDLNTLPFPARDILVENKLNVAQISTSRGCTGRCSFCSSQLFWHKWRGRDVQSVVDEIESIVTNYGVRMFSFIDSSFEDPGIRYGRIQGIADEMNRRNLRINYMADFQARFHRDATPVLMESLKNSGLISAMIGIETGNEFDRVLYNKRATLEDNQKTIRLFKDYGITVKCGFINFNPYSTFDGLRQNIDFLEEYGYAANLECTATRFVMYKGTSLYHKILGDSLLKEGEFHETGYKFVDPRIEPLAEYVCNYMRQKNAVGNAFARIRYIYPYYMSQIAGCKRQFDNDTHRRAYQVVSEFETMQLPQILEFCSSVNQQVAKWFRALLEVAEKGWDPEQVDKVSEAFLNSEYVQTTAVNIDRIKNKLYLSLSRLGPEYGDYLARINS